MEDLAQQQQQQREPKQYTMVGAARMEVAMQLRLALPMMGTNLVQFAVQLISVMFVGHLGELQLSAASVATSLCVVTGTSFLLGLASALETFCGQAYGAKQYVKLGVYLQRAVFVLMVISLPIAIIWINMEAVLLFFGQDPDIAHYAGVYARWLIPELFAYSLLQPLVKFLQAQGVVLPMLVSSTFSMLFHILLCYLTMHKLGMGFTGAALSTSISYWLNALLLVAVVAYIPRCKQCWGGFTLELFRDVLPFVKLALSSALMICLEWWSFELIVLLSGLLPNPQLETSVFAVVVNMVQLCYMFPFGISAAASTRVSNELGAGRPSAARFAFIISMSLATLDGVLIFSAMMLLRNLLGRAFSNEQEVVNYVSRVVPFLASLAVMDAYGGTLSGICRGCGWQVLAAVSNFLAYYAVGLPIGYTLGFVAGLRGEGLLIGVLCGVSMQALVLFIISLTTNWTKEADAARTRMAIEEPLLV